MIKLFVDDLRVAPEGWVCVRTITEAIRLLATQRVELVSLDHDIVYVDERGQFTGKVNAENFTAVAWFIREMKEKPRMVYVHTSNPTGATAIQSILQEHVPTRRDMTYAHEWMNIPEREEV